jgi:hypothetical protein
MDEFASNLKNVQQRVKAVMQTTANCLAFNSDFASADIPPSVSARLGYGCAYPLGYPGQGAEKKLCHGWQGEVGMPLGQPRLCDMRPRYYQYLL